MLQAKVLDIDAGKKARADAEQAVWDAQQPQSEKDKGSDKEKEKASLAPPFSPP